jgi:hypothetical protein
MKIQTYIKELEARRDIASENARALSHEAIRDAVSAGINPEGAPENAKYQYQFGVLFTLASIVAELKTLNPGPRPDPGPEPEPDDEFWLSHCTRCCEDLMPEEMRMDMDLCGYCDHITSKDD